MHPRVILVSFTDWWRFCITEKGTHTSTRWKACRRVRHLGTDVLALAHAFAHVVFSSSSFFPPPIHACVFTRIWSVAPLIASVGSVVCTTLWQAGSEWVLIITSVVLPLSYQRGTTDRGCSTTDRGGNAQGCSWVRSTLTGQVGSGRVS